MFENLRTIIVAAGGQCGAILQLTIWIADPSAGDAINKYWLQMFPDPHSRPVRHVVKHPLQGGLLVQCEALAVVS